MRVINEKSPDKLQFTNLEAKLAKYGLTLNFSSKVEHYAW